MTKKLVSMFLALVICLSLSVPALAAENKPEVTTETEEYTFAYLLPDDAENVHYSYNGAITFKEGNEYKFIDGQTGEVSILGVEHHTLARTANIDHVPADIGEWWIWFHTDGPYKCEYDLLNIWDFCESLADGIEYAVIISELSVSLGVAAGVAVALYGLAKTAHNGGVTTAAYWRIDDTYHLANDYAMFHVECYWYSTPSCKYLIDKEYKEWHG